jgi:hypothetical protein
MTLDPTWLFISLIPGAIGFVLLAYGKKQQRWPFMLAGLAYLLYPYFTTSLTFLIGVGLAIAGGLGLELRMGH